MKKLAASFSPLTEEAAIKAAEAWRKYRAGGGPRNRIDPDVLIGGMPWSLLIACLPLIEGFTVDILRAFGYWIPRPCGKVELGLRWQH
jgi:hypothetical protein